MTSSTDPGSNGRHTGTSGNRTPAQHPYMLPLVRARQKRAEQEWKGPVCIESWHAMRATFGSSDLLPIRRVTDATHHSHYKAPATTWKKGDATDAETERWALEGYYPGLRAGVRWVHIDIDIVRKDEAENEVDRSIVRTSRDALDRRHDGPSMARIRANSSRVTLIYRQSITDPVPRTITMEVLSPEDVRLVVVQVRVGSLYTQLAGVHPSGVPFSWEDAGATVVTTSHERIEAALAELETWLVHKGFKVRRSGSGAKLRRTEDGVTSTEETSVYDPCHRANSIDNLITAIRAMRLYEIKERLEWVQRLHPIKAAGGGDERVYEVCREESLKWDSGGRKSLEEIEAEFDWVWSSIHTVQFECAADRVDELARLDDRYDGPRLTDNRFGSVAAKDFQVLDGPSVAGQTTAPRDALLRSGKASHRAYADAFIRSGRAQCFVCRCRDEVWLIYRDGRFQASGRGGSNAIKREIGDWLVKMGPKLATANRIEAIERLLRGLLMVDDSEFNSDRSVLGCRECAMVFGPLAAEATCSRGGIDPDLCTGWVPVPLSPTLRLTKGTNLTPGDPALGKKWLKRWLLPVADYRWPLAKAIIMILARALYPGRVTPLLFNFVGEGANGKSVLIKLIRTLFGTYSVVIEASALARGRSTDVDKPRPDLMATEGAWIVISNEVKGRRSDEDLLKRFVGREALIVRQLYSGEMREIVPGVLLVFGNEAMRFHDPDEAMADRVVVLPLDHKFERDPATEERLEREFAEHGGHALAYLVECAAKWRGAVDLPSEVLAETKATLDEQNPLRRLPPAAVIGGGSPDDTMTPDEIVGLCQGAAPALGVEIPFDATTASLMKIFWPVLARMDVTRQHTSAGTLYKRIRQMPEWMK